MYFGLMDHGGRALDEDLDPEQVDGNFWKAIQDIAAKAGQGVGISNFVSNRQSIHGRAD